MNVVVTGEQELRLVRLARELAMDMQPVPAVLQRLGLTTDELERLQRLPKFQKILAAECAAWESALNTHERVKLKAAAIIEDFLPEAHARMHNPAEALPAKTEVAKLVTRLAGMGLERTGEAGAGGGEKFLLQINIGDGKGHGLAAGMATEVSPGTDRLDIDPSRRVV